MQIESVAKRSGAVFQATLAQNPKNAPTMLVATPNREAVVTGTTAPRCELRPVRTNKLELHSAATRSAANALVLRPKSEPVQGAGSERVSKRTDLNRSDSLRGSTSFS